MRGLRCSQWPHCMLLSLGLGSYIHHDTSSLEECSAKQWQAGFSFLQPQYFAYYKVGILYSKACISDERISECLMDYQIR